MYKKTLILSFCFSILGASCAPLSILQPDYISLIDIKYKLNLMKVQNSSDNQNVDIGSLSFYQGSLSPVLNSTCHHYPTDSRYARLLFSKCSWPASIIKTTARYFSEPDASILYLNQTIENNRTYFVDLPERCSL
ncbi:MAG: membrane protein insertion efficiency factor YidD [Bacteriovorax sp.]|nr:membrane protein insertion efficiency factor YidD [Bacteriovorax sp.]